jgi:hypothetical protein
VKIKVIVRVPEPKLLKETIEGIKSSGISSTYPNVEIVIEVGKSQPTIST